MTNDGNGTKISLNPRISDVFRQVTRYGFVGLGGSVLDLLLFNFALIVTDLFFGFYEPLGSKIFSTALSAWATYYFHRGWTFSNRGRHESEAVSLGLFATVTLVGLFVSTGVVGISHYVFGFTSLAENNLANLVAIALSGVVRFALTRTFVFPDSQFLTFRRRGASDDA